LGIVGLPPKMAPPPKQLAATRSGAATQPASPAAGPRQRTPKNHSAEACGSI
jgi:hypothetical protein